MDSRARARNIRARVWSAFSCSGSRTTCRWCIRPRRRSIFTACGGRRSRLAQTTGRDYSQEPVAASESCFQRWRIVPAERSNGSCPTRRQIGRAGPTQSFSAPEKFITIWSNIANKTNAKTWPSFALEQLYPLRHRTRSKRLCILRPRHSGLLGAGRTREHGRVDISCGFILATIYLGAGPSRGSPGRLRPLRRQVRIGAHKQEQSEIINRAFGEK